MACDNIPEAQRIIELISPITLCWAGSFMVNQILGSKYIERSLLTKDTFKQLVQDRGISEGTTCAFPCSNGAFYVKTSPQASIAKDAEPVPAHLPQLKDFEEMFSPNVRNEKFIAPFGWGSWSDCTECQKLIAAGVGLYPGIIEQFEFVLNAHNYAVPAAIYITVGPSTGDQITMATKLLDEADVPEGARPDFREIPYPAARPQLQRLRLRRPAIRRDPIKAQIPFVIAYLSPSGAETFTPVKTEIDLDRLRKDGQSTYTMVCKADSPGGGAILEPTSKNRWTPSSPEVLAPHLQDKNPFQKEYAEAFFQLLY